MATDSRMKYLQKLHLSYYVRIKVPPSLQAKVGNTHIRRALHTRNLDEANKLKWAMIASIKRELEQLKTLDPDGIKAKLYRDAIKEAKAAEDHNSVMLLEECAAEQAEKVHEATANLAKAKEWYQKATTDQKLLSELLDDWLGHKIPTVMHKTYSSGSWRQTSLQLANQIKYENGVEKAAKGLLKFATS